MLLDICAGKKFTLAVIDLSLQGTNNAWDKDAIDPNLDGYQLLNAAYSEGIPTIVVSGITEPEESSTNLFRAFDIRLYRKTSL